MKCRKAAATAGSVLWIGMCLAGLSYASESPAEAILKATPGQFEAGTVAEGKTIEVIASVQNVGSAPVEITNVRTS